MRAPAVLLLLLLLFLAFSLGWSERFARADDAAPALEELKAGYALKKQGDCRDAVPHFVASQRLAPSAKALLNLADCELRLGDVVAARAHAVAGLELARQRNDDELAAIAQAQIVAIDAARAAAARHATPLEPEPVEPAPSTSQPQAPPPQNPDQSATPPPALRPASPRAEKTGTPTGRVVAYVLGGAGVVGIGIGAGYGIDAISKNGASNAGGHCDSAGCDPAGKRLREQALSSATVSTVAFGVGLAALAAGIVLYAVTPGGVEVQPSVGASYGGVTVGGRW